LLIEFCLLIALNKFKFKEIFKTESLLEFNYYWEEGISSIFWALMLRKLLMIEIFEVQGRRAYLLIR
jgi:hypothetical protein